MSVTQSKPGQGSSAIDAQSGNRSYTVTRMNMRAVSRLTMTGTGAVTDTISDIDMGVRGNITISCSGAANSILYCSVFDFLSAVVHRHDGRAER